MTSYIFAKWIKIYQIKIKQEKETPTKQDFCDDVLVVNSAMKKINISATPPTVSVAAAAAASEFLDFTNQVQWLQLLLNLEAILLLLPLYVLL